MKRYYFAITNACNRSCELCSCYSTIGKSTYLSFARYKEIITKKDTFEVQLEGGEPLLHPNLEEMINYAQDTGRCERLILGTNGVLLPYQYNNDGQLNKQETIKAIVDYFSKFKPQFMLKPSINHHFIAKDKLLLDKSETIRDAFNELSNTGKYEVVFNVRRRKKAINGADKNKMTVCEDDDQWLVDELKKRDLDIKSNIFFYQRYGFASGNIELEPPFIIANPVDFYLVSPDGKIWGTDLVARSEGMKNLR